MMRLGLAIVLWATSLGTQAVEPRLTMEGYGAARIGMTREALANALGVPLAEEPVTASDDGSCTYVYPATSKAPTTPTDEGVGYMLLNGHLARIDILAPTIKTPLGAHLGMSERALRNLYGARLVVTQHFYGGKGDHYLTLRAANGALGMRFETVEGNVNGLYAGTTKAIQFVEGCQ
jgi:hypothetical protein